MAARGCRGRPAAPFHPMFRDFLQRLLPATSLQFLSIYWLPSSAEGIYFRLPLSLSPELGSGAVVKPHLVGAIGTSHCGSCIINKTPLFNSGFCFHFYLLFTFFTFLSFNELLTVRWQISHARTNLSIRKRTRNGTSSFGPQKLSPPSSWRSHWCCVCHQAKDTRYIPLHPTTDHTRAFTHHNSHLTPHLSFGQPQSLFTAIPIFPNRSPSLLQPPSHPATTHTHKFHTWLLPIPPKKRDAATTITNTTTEPAHTHISHKFQHQINPTHKTHNPCGPSSGPTPRPPK